MSNTNGLTQKDEIHTRINQRPTRMELTGWLSVTVMILGVIVNSIMS